MPVISLRIPQLGEGLREALLIEFLKQPGDAISRDEAIYVMETDKAATEVESPHQGTLVEWLVEPGSVLAIGAEVARMEVTADIAEVPHGHEPVGPGAATAATSPLPSASRSASAPERTRANIPPRTMKYLKQKGLAEVATQIPISRNKLMPDDVDRYLAARDSASETSADAFNTVDLPQTQIVLNYRFTRGAHVCVPGSVTKEIGWGRLEAIRESLRDSGGPTPFTMSCWCVVQALKTHPRFRSILSEDGRTLKEFNKINLGVAVSLPDDRLVTAVISDAGSLDQRCFYNACSEAIATARKGQDQADDATTLTVSNIGGVGMRSGIPLIVAPAMATLALGEAFDQAIPHPEKGFEFIRRVTAVLSFDHRITNGVGAAHFMNDIQSLIENVTLAQS